ncbi:hypothetical protein NVV78_07805 [Pediococcus ethanolidurans]|uniref:hypothetical protein n=1 Tax=Pediococcus ethanolidurans TaxID=319653 RepID=UPI0020A6E62C|nr:hypothetical protein [Pediococcus ethanolidurans]MCV3315844.1 hypothetical protein [Pediococcus ethanolidurans]MCV3327569.1 hypothetical protein [Pediococcus ethanolidurans]
MQLFSAEDGASKILNEALDRYEQHFKEGFPIYEYINITSNDDYDISISGVKKLADFISKRIEINLPVEVPKDYWERMY